MSNRIKHKKIKKVNMIMNESNKIMIKMIKMLLKLNRKLQLNPTLTIIIMKVTSKTTPLSNLKNQFKRNNCNRKD